MLVLPRPEHGYVSKYYHALNMDMFVSITTP